MSAAGCHNVCLKSRAEIWSPLLPRCVVASSKFFWKHRQPFAQELGSFCVLPLWELFGGEDPLNSLRSWWALLCWKFWKLFCVVWRTDALGETQSKACPGTQERLCVCPVFNSHTCTSDTGLLWTDPWWRSLSRSSQSGKEARAAWRLYGLCWPRWGWRYFHSLSAVLWVFLFLYRKEMPFHH